MKLRAVVAADELRAAATRGEDSVQHPDGSVGIDPPATLDDEGLARELVDDMQQLQDPAVGSLVELEVDRPHMIGALSGQPCSGHRRVSQPPALSAAHRHTQALLAPQTLHPLSVHLPALAAQRGMRAAVAPPRPLAGDLTQPATQRPVISGDTRLPALGGAVLSYVSARPPLREPETVLEHQDRGSTTRRAHQFPGMRMLCESRGVRCGAYGRGTGTWGSLSEHANGQAVLLKG